MKQYLNRLWEESAPLTATTIIMMVALVASLVGMAIDARTITGVNAWLKPAKFAISTAIFTGTIAWLYSYITVSPKLKRRLGWILTLAVNIEVAIIDLQAARGTSSHFNATTTLDIILFAVMGIWIAVLLVATIGVFVLLMRQKFVDPVWGWTLRLSLLITILGAASAGFMLHPTPEERSQHLSGGHTVGALDGGPGIPGLGWSTEHGDLRIPHFFGLHAIQIIPFLAFLIGRRRRAKAPVFVLSGSYLAFISILTWQALRGESVIRPGPETLAAFGVWLAISASALVATQLAVPSHQPVGVNS